MNNNEILSVDDIRRIYFEETGEIDEKCKIGFEWHLKHDKDKFEVINMIGDVALCQDDSVNYLASEIIKLLEKDDAFMGQQVVACIMSYMKLPEYVPFFLDFFYNDRGFEDDQYIKRAILSSLGKILKDLSNILLQKKVIHLLVNQVQDPGCKNYDYSSYRSILEVLGIDASHLSGLDFNRETDIDWNIVEQFKQKYLGTPDVDKPPKSL
jgi:hypothetical protein